MTCGWLDVADRAPRVVAPQLAQQHRRALLLAHTLEVIRMVVERVGETEPEKKSKGESSNKELFIEAGGCVPAVPLTLAWGRAPGVGGAWCNANASPRRRVAVWVVRADRVTALLVLLSQPLANDSIRAELLEVLASLIGTRQLTTPVATLESVRVKPVFCVLGGHRRTPPSPPLASR